MSEQPDRASGVTYVGPRAFVIAFCIVCGVFLALFFGVGALTAPLETIAPDSVGNASTVESAPGAGTTGSPLPATQPRRASNPSSPARSQASSVKSPAKAPAVRTLAKAPEIRTAAKAPELPTVAKAPELPTVAKAPELPTVAKAPELPTVAKAPELPTAPKAPELPTAMKARASFTGLKTTPSPAKASGAQAAPHVDDAQKPGAQKPGAEGQAVKQRLLVPFKSAPVEHGTGQLTPRANAPDSLLTGTSALPLRPPRADSTQP
jgi:hypothetical protein